MYKNIIKDSIRNHYKNIVNLITFTFNRFKINFMYYLEIYAALVYSILFFALTTISISKISFSFPANSFLALRNLLIPSKFASCKLL